MSYLCQRELNSVSSLCLATIIDNNHINQIRKIHFSENEMQRAAECVASFQVLNTTDPNMINNKNYYLAEVG